MPERKGEVIVELLGPTRAAYPFGFLALARLPAIVTEHRTAAGTDLEGWALCWEGRRRLDRLRYGLLRRIRVYEGNMPIMSK